VRGSLGKPMRPPVWPNVIGVIGIIIGIGGVLLGAWQAVSVVFFDFMMKFIPQNAPNVPETMAAMNAWMPWIVAIGIASALVAVMLLIGSAGLAAHKPWSRPLLITWAIVKILIVLTMTIQSFLMSRAFMAQTGAQGTPAPMFILDSVLLISLVFNIIFYCGFPVFVLVWLNLRGPKRDVASWRPAPTA
jgi:hypothetical protein